ncbi:MAG: EamA family transporter, partial [Boseongicola sp.]|nr:EamA family transporter [Boseongicola sp.]
SDPPEGGSLINRASGIGLASGVFFALSAVSYRGATLEMATGDPLLTGGLTLAVVTLWQTVALGLWLAVFQPGQIGRTLRAWRRTALVGLFSLIGSWGWFAAFSLANAAYVFAVGQIELILSLMVGWLAFRERVTLRELLGIAILTVSILGVAFWS